MRTEQRFQLSRALYLLCALAILLTPLLAGGVAAAAPRYEGAVYVLSNAADSNAVLVFSRAGDGSLAPAGSVPTGGRGTGSGLGSQGALVLSEDGRWLLAVNAGSNNVSVFAVRGTELRRTELASSGGEQPISVTIHDDLVYVLNSGGSGNISGFQLRGNGTLSAIRGSTRALSNGGTGAAPGPAQVQFSSDGRALVVTEKATNLIDTFQVRRGLASEASTHPSAGTTPFGFDIDKHNHVIVSEAFGGAAGQSAMSSYALRGNNLRTLSPSVATTQTAACWVVISDNGRYAYTTNAGSASVSSYRIDRAGRLTLLAASAGATGGGPIDMDMSRGSGFLYTLNGGAHNISAFRVREDGQLSALGAFGTLPAGAVGLIAQ